jgi:hypothetical protein
MAEGRRQRAAKIGGSGNLVIGKQTEASETSGDIGKKRTPPGAAVPHEYRGYNLGSTIPVCFWYFPALSL